jgi:hypothetical protein
MRRGVLEFLVRPTYRTVLTIPHWLVNRKSMAICADPCVTSITVQSLLNSLEQTMNNLAVVRQPFVAPKE